VNEMINNLPSPFRTYEDVPDEDKASVVAMNKIINSVKFLIQEAVDARDVNFAGLHPRIIISNVTTNILINLFYGAVNKDETDIKKRLEMAESLAKEILTVFLDSVQKIETGQATPTGGVN
jgi:hypothetical protein